MLNGLLGEMRARRATEMARGLEAFAHAGDLTGCDERVASLLAEIEALKPPLREFVETLSPS